MCNDNDDESMISFLLLYGTLSHARIVVKILKARFSEPEYVKEAPSCLPSTVPSAMVQSVDCALTYTLTYTARVVRLSITSKRYHQLGMHIPGNMIILRGMLIVLFGNGPQVADTKYGAQKVWAARHE